MGSHQVLLVLFKSPISFSTNCQLLPLWTEIQLLSSTPLTQSSLGGSYCLVQQLGRTEMRTGNAVWTILVLCGCHVISLPVLYLSVFQFGEAFASGSWVYKSWGKCSLKKKKICKWNPTFSSSSGEAVMVLNHSLCMVMHRTRANKWSSDQTKMRILLVGPFLFCELPPLIMLLSLSALEPKAALSIRLFGLTPNADLKAFPRAEGSHGKENGNVLNHKSEQNFLCLCCISLFLKVLLVKITRSWGEGSLEAGNQVLCKGTRGIESYLW